MAPIRPAAYGQQMTDNRMPEPADRRPSREEPDPIRTTDADTDPRPIEGIRPTNDREAAYRREKDEFGGIKFGTAFFGWLTATGLTVLLGALASAAIAGLGGATNTDVTDAATDAPAATSIAGVVVLLVILLISYFAGGYVAGRMARFSGAKQGVAVWIWGLVVAIILAIVAAIAGSQFDLLGRVGALPRISFDGGQVLGGVLALVGLVAVTIVGAVLGGVVGMRFHRRVDRVGSPSNVEGRTS